MIEKMELSEDIVVVVIEGLADNFHLCYEM
jgi:hypothetical protein